MAIVKPVPNVIRPPDRPPRKPKRSRDEFQPEAVILAAHRPPSRLRPVVELATGHVYPTATSLAMELGVDPQRVGRACLAGNPIKGRRFRAATRPERDEFIRRHWPHWRMV